LIRITIFYWEELGSICGDFCSEKVNLPCTGGSDAHSKNSVGRYIFEDDHIKDEWELINVLKRGGY
jgi:hypothetical protein